MCCLYLAQISIFVFIDFTTPIAHCQWCISRQLLSMQQSMFFLLLVFGVTTLRADNECSCNCCIGPTCSAGFAGYVNLQTCSTDVCLAQCRCLYPNCLASAPYGQAYAVCKPPVSIPSRCQCQCCNTGFPSCQPNPVGEAIAYRCDNNECTITCLNRYPSLCGWNGTGVTAGTCLGPVTTTTVMTTTPYAPWQGNLCSCCRGGSPCTSNLIFGVASASQCSSSACTQACQNRYVSSCLSSSSANQISGTCATQVTGNIRCKCNCCSGAECFDYELNANGTCSICNDMCRQMSPCMNNMYLPTSACFANHGHSLVDFSLSVNFLTALLFFKFSQQV